MTDYTVDDMLLVNGFLQGICEHIAIEQTKGRPDSEEVQKRSLFLQVNYQERLIGLLSLVSQRNDLQELIDLLEEKAGDGLSPEAKEEHLPILAGYILGVACAGYTPVLVGTANLALSIMTGELWFAQLVTPTQGTFILGEEVRLESFAKTKSAYLLLRWMTDDDPEHLLFQLKGMALPEGYQIPLADLTPIRECIAAELLPTEPNKVN